MRLLEWGWRAAGYLSSASQTCCMGFRFVDLSFLFILGISDILIYALTSSALYVNAQSSIKINWRRTEYLNNRTQDSKISFTDSSQSIPLKNEQISEAVQHNAAETITPLITVHLYDVGRTVTGFLFSRYVNSSKIIVHSESGLISEENISPLCPRLRLI